jgi:hypothetical protein
MNELLHEVAAEGFCHVLLASSVETIRLFVWLVADGWCWFVMREKYCWLVAGLF